MLPDYRTIAQFVSNNHRLDKALSSPEKILVDYTRSQPGTFGWLSFQISGSGYKDAFKIHFMVLFKEVFSGSTLGVFIH